MKGMGEMDAAAADSSHSSHASHLELCLSPATLRAMHPVSSSPHSRFTGPPTLALLAAICLASIAAPSTVSAAGHPDTAGWPDLFAKDLSNAVAPAKWSFGTDGALVAGDHETLWTKEAYGNFILDLEFKVAKESNSGIFLRSSNIKNVLAALEIQVHEKTDGTKYGMVGAIYDAMPPGKDASKPVGEWNHCTITCQDSLVSVVLNGEEIIRADLNNWPEVKKNPDGTANKFPVALKNFARKGPVGLQGLHGAAQAPVWYRNLKVKVLP